MTDFGALAVWIKNTGGLSSNFEISLSCSEMVSKINSKKLSLGSLEEKKIEMTIVAESNKKTEHKCSLSLINSLGNVVDHEIVKFSTRKTIFENPQKGNNTGVTNNTIFSNDKPPQIHPERCTALCGENGSDFCKFFNV